MLQGKKLATVLIQVKAFMNQPLVGAFLTTKHFNDWANHCLFNEEQRTTFISMLTALTDDDADRSRPTIFVGDDVRYPSLGGPQIGRVLGILDDTLMIYVVSGGTYHLMKKRDISAVFPRFQEQPKKPDNDAAKH